MIIDSHTHTFPERIAAGTIETLSGNAHIKPALEATVGALASSMERAGIDLSINLPVATSARQVPKLNDSAAAINEAAAEAAGGPKVISFGCMHPDYEDWHEELSRAARMGLKGIKIHPPYQGVDIDDIRYLRIIDRAAQLGLTVITHAGLDVGLPGVDRCRPSMCRNVIEQIGEFPFILAHMGGWRCWEEVPEQLAGTGVYLDTSFSEGSLDAFPDGYWTGDGLLMLGEEEFLGLIRTFGADQILFGTDSPWADQKKCLDRVRALPLTEEEKEKILGGNAKKLLGV